MLWNYASCCNNFNYRIWKWFFGFFRRLKKKLFCWFFLLFCGVSQLTLQEYTSWLIFIRRLKFSKYLCFFFVFGGWRTSIFNHVIKADYKCSSDSTLRKQLFNILLLLRVKTVTHSQQNQPHKINCNKEKCINTMSTTYCHRHWK